jgi:predicted CoA-binding protein
MQLGVVNEEAAAVARKSGLIVVMDRCPAIEMPRLGLLHGEGRGAVVN